MSSPPTCRTDFLRNLRERGLKVANDDDPLSVELVISDARSGIKAATKAILAGAGWQRCRVNFARNVTQKLGPGTPSRSAR
jgi:putative transposase